MNTKKHFILALSLMLALACNNARAMFFFFIPGSVTSAIGDALDWLECHATVKRMKMESDSALEVCMRGKGYKIEKKSTGIF